MLSNARTEWSRIEYLHRALAGLVVGLLIGGGVCRAQTVGDASVPPHEEMSAAELVLPGPVVVFPSGGADRAGVSRTTDSWGRGWPARFHAVDFRSLELAPRQGAVPLSSRSGKRIVAGILIGATVGALLFLTPMTQEACLNKPRWHCAAVGAVVFAPIGGIIAWKHP
jgi:hypothetical protein